MLALVHQTRTPTGQTVYHLEADAGCIEHLIFRGVFPMQFSTLTLIVMFGTAARIDPLVGLCAVSVVPALYVAVKAYTQQLAQRADRVKLIESVMGAFAHEFIERLPNGYHTEMEKAGAAQSGGPRQRLSEGRR